jgi:hypothetical integral membrane protein (TIGR02206 family)
MNIFGPIHISLLLSIVFTAAALNMLCRRGIFRPRIVCRIVGVALMANECAWWIWQYSREGIHAGNLPLQLCDAAVWLAGLACVTRKQPLAEFTYFAGLAGAGMALLTPDLAAPWPRWPAIYFFLAHGGIVIAAVLLAFSGVTHFKPRSVWRPFVMLLLWAAIAGIADAVLGGNYMYLRSKPASATPLDSFGPWPWYLVTAAALGLTLFCLLWLPVRPVLRATPVRSQALAGR